MCITSHNPEMQKSPNMVTTTEYHEETSRRFLSQAREEFNRGDLAQSSEKAWGAVAHYIKAISEERGWEHNHHGKVLRNAALILGNPPPASRYVELLGLVQGLHQNFYEGGWTREMVDAGLSGAEELINALGRHRTNGTC